MSYTEDEADEIPEYEEEETEQLSEQTESVIPESSSLSFEYEITCHEGEFEYVDVALQEDLQRIKEIGDSGEEEEGIKLQEEGSLESIYDTRLFKSRPYISVGGTLTEDILEFDFSYGYNCRKYYNIVVMDESTLVFGSGNYLHFYNIQTGEIWFKRSALGGGIGAIKKNFIYNHLAVAECGKRPVIILYEWPSMVIFGVLKDGTTKSYSGLDYSNDGLLLVSQGGEPDFNITVWNWPQKKILLRTKSYVNDVFKVRFNNENPGQLASAGLSHIKFWKMANTFTGLKLKGEVGRFGKTEYSDIVGVALMPDGKVVSGCAWGNILVWDDGLIKLEVMRTQRKPCHDLPIVQIAYNGAELWTASMDGHIKVWWYDKIDQADPPDDDRVVQVEPTYDFETPGVMIMGIDRLFLPEAALTGSIPTIYIIQDGNGGIWQIDLNTEGDPVPPFPLFNCHGGRIMDIVACPYDHYLISLGNEGKLILYDYTIQKQLYTHKFPANGTCMIWLPVEIQPCGDQLIVGFDDGQLRVCIVHLHDADSYLRVVQVIKPHNKPVRKLSVNKTGNVLVTSGEDPTIFIFKLEAGEQITILVPIGYFPTPDVVTCITWDPNYPAEVLVGCEHGHMLQVAVPTEPQDYTTISYLLDLKPKTNRFITYKAQIRRDIQVREIEARKAAKVERKRKELDKLKKENPGLAIDDEVFLADSDSEEELAPLHIPEVPNNILWLKYTENHTIWLSMAGYDAGYIYEFHIDQMDTKPYRFKMIHDGDDIEISSYVYSHKQQLLIFGMEDGKIRVNKVNPNNFTDLSNYWQYSMHDNFNGFISKMVFSWDEEYFFSAGYDGNIFAYKFNPKDYERIKLYYILLPNKRTIEIPELVDTCGSELLSLDEKLVKAEQDRINRVANMHKSKTRKTINRMQALYEDIMEQNNKLLPSQQLSSKDLEIDPRITAYIQDQFAARIALVKRKLAYDVEKSKVRLDKIKQLVIRMDLLPIQIKGISSKIFVRSLRQIKLPPNLDQIKEKIEVRMREEAARGRPAERSIAPPKIQEIKRDFNVETEYFLLSLSNHTIENKLGSRLTRTLENYRRRVLKWKVRAVEWEIFNAKKPKPNENHPSDEYEYDIAKSSIGSYILKTDSSYTVPFELKETTTKKYKQVLLTKEEVFNLIHDFSMKVYGMRITKYKIIGEITKLEKALENLHKEIPADLVVNSPPIESYDEAEFPENNLNVVVIMQNYGNEKTVDEEEDDIILDLPPTPNELELEILPRRAGYPLRHTSGKYFDVLDILDKLTSIREATFPDLISYAKNEQVDTFYERELRVWRLNRLLYEQILAIKKKDQLINNFDKKVADLNNTQMEVIFHANIKELHILKLSQELMVLSKFEANESILEQQVLNNNTALLDKKDFITNIKNQVEDIQTNNDENNIRMEHINEKFSQMTNNNKFYDFLRKVFKKKYKMPKIRSDDDSSSDSSSSSSDDFEEDDAASIDSRDFGIIKLDLNVCPKGCEQAIYDYTINLRSKRYEIEFAIKENEKKNDALKKELEMYIKQSSQLENILKQSKHDLWEYQREKQRALNTIMCTLILKMDQIQLYSDKHMHNVEDCILIDKNVLSNLYKRVGQLEAENLEEKNKRDVYIRHLLRMKRDFLFMDNKIKKIKNEVVYQMYIKFGRVIDLNDVEIHVIKSQLKSDITDLAEVRLKKMVYELRLKNINIKGQYSSRILCTVNTLTGLQHKYLMVLKANTARNELLRILKQKAEILEKEVIVQNSQISKYDEFLAKLIDDKNEVKKIQRIIEAQRKEIQDLKDEITMLKTKGYPPKPIREVAPEELEEEPIAYEEYIPETIDEKVSKQIVLPTTIEEEYTPKDIINQLLDELFGKLGEALERRSVENMAKDILEKVLKCTSCHEIIMELIDSLPLKPSKDQLELIEDTAEKLFELQEIEMESSEEESDKMEYFTMLLDDIIDETMLIKGNINEVVKRMLLRIVDEVPLRYLIRKQCIDKLALKLGPKISEESIRLDILPEITEIAEFHQEDLRTVVSALIIKMTSSGDQIAREVVENIVENIMTEKGETHKVIAHIVEDIVKKIPTRNLLIEENFEIVLDIIKEKFERKLDVESFLEGLSSIEVMRISDVRMILNIILHNVYDTGLDYLFVVNEKTRNRMSY